MSGSVSSGVTTPTDDSTGSAVGAAATSTIVARAGGVRRSDHSPDGLSGLTFGAWDVNLSSSRAIPTTPPTTTCVTQTIGTTTGVCLMTVNLVSSRRFVVAPVAPAPGYDLITDLKTSFEGAGYTFNVLVRPGATVLLPDANRRWASRKENPVWPAVCGMNVALLLDNSSSISASERIAMVDAANAFVDALTGTPSRVAVWRFSDGVTQTRTLTSVKSAADAAQLKAFISALPQGNGNTNWDAAFYGLVQSSERYDATILVSDGSPTATGVPREEWAASPRVAYIEAAMHSANSLKGKGVRIVSLGVGVTGDEQRNFEAISSDSDYYGTSYAQLGARLTEVAMTKCSGTVTVEKQFGSSAQSSVTTASDGWQYDAQVLGGGLLDHAADTTRVINDFGGLAQFGVSGGTWPKQLRITEPAVPGYALEDIRCQLAGLPVGVADLATRSILVPVDASDAVQCLFVSSQNVATPTPTPTNAPIPASTGPTALAASAAPMSPSPRPAIPTPTPTPDVAAAPHATAAMSTVETMADDEHARRRPSVRPAHGARPIATSVGAVVPAAVPAGAVPPVGLVEVVPLGVLLLGAAGVALSVRRLRRADR